jgi:hypothetical protein
MPNICKVHATGVSHEQRERVPLFGSCTFDGSFPWPDVVVRYHYLVDVQVMVAPG